MTDDEISSNYLQDNAIPIVLGMMFMAFWFQVDESIRTQIAEGAVTFVWLAVGTTLITLTLYLGMKIVQMSAEAAEE